MTLCKICNEDPTATNISAPKNSSVNTEEILRDSRKNTEKHIRSKRFEVISLHLLTNSIEEK